MIIVSIEENAGIGNQLFQYAHAYALAEKYNQKLLIVSYIGRADCVREYMLNRLCLDQSRIVGIIRVDKANIFKGKSFRGANLLNKLYRKHIQNCMEKKCQSGQIEKRKLSKTKARMYYADKPLVEGKDYYLEGFYESYKYFIESADSVRKQLKLKDIPKDKAVREMIQKITSCNSVAMHIRMGDFTLCKRVFPIEYYNNAMQYIETKLEEPQFFIMSEDNDIKEFFQAKGKTNIHIINVQAQDRDIIEWYLLSLCLHHVITNSTYSWWSAFAAAYPDKKVFIPSQKLYLERENADIYLDEATKSGEDHYLNYFLPEYTVLP